MFLAAREGKAEAVQMLLNSGADVHIRCRKTGDTPLITASNEGHGSVVNKLLAAGSDIDGSNLNGWTALIYAAYYDYHEVIPILIEHGASLNQTSQVSPASLSLVFILLFILASPCCQAGCTALYRASADGKEKSVRLLIEAGADVNLANSSGNTPLSVASRNGHVPVVKLLLEAGAVVDTLDVVSYCTSAPYMFIMHCIFSHTSFS